MKKQLLLILSFFSFLGIKAQQYYVGVPANEVLSSWGVTSGNCYPSASGRMAVTPGAFPYVTGMTMAFKVTAINAPAGSVYTTPGSTIKVGDTLALPTNGTNGGYEFYFSSGGSGSTVTLDLIAYGTPQTLNESYDCDMSDAVLSIVPCPRTVIVEPAGFCTVLAPVSVQELSPMDVIAVFPNPNSGSFLIDKKKDEYFHLSVFDVLGNKILEEVLSAARTSLSLGSAGSGIYILKIYDEKENLFDVRKIVVE